MTPERQFFPVALTPASKDALERVVDELGMTQQAVLARLLGWFAAQDEDLQRLVLGLCPRDCVADVARLLLRRRRPRPARRDGRGR